LVGKQTRRPLEDILCPLLNYTIEKSLYFFAKNDYECIIWNRILELLQQYIIREFFFLNDFEIVQFIVDFQIVLSESNFHGESNFWIVQFKNLF